TVEDTLLDLTKQLKNIGIAVYDGDRASERNIRISGALAAADDAWVVAATDPPGMLSPQSPAALQSKSVAFEATGNTDESAFRRLYEPSNDYYLTQSNLTLSNSLTPDHPQNQAFDWRLGVPDLMSLIGVRMNVLTAVDPTWRTTTASLHVPELD